MGTKNITRKFKVAFKVLRDQGLLGFVIMCLQFIQKYTSKRHTPKKTLIFTKARYEDIINVDPKNAPKPWRGTSKTKLTFNWLMPPPGKGSGGHHNIFRFIKVLEEAGHICRIYIYTFEGRGSISAVRATMGDSYPKFNAPMEWIGDANKMEEADGIFATSWETAYPAYNFSDNAKRFYFVQDFEPYFYPIGSLYALAENTYKFGFYGITAGGWLSKKLSRDYGMRTDNYDFGSDGQIYSFKNSSLRKELFFYARPYTERRGFEMGVMALDLFHQKHPDYVINIAGYDVSNYDLPFPYINLKTLEIDELNNLYNKCAVGLVLSFTNMSLLPLELLSAGTIPIVNDAENNRLVSNNKFISYTPNDPRSIAEALSTLVSMKDLPKYALKAARSVESNTWEEAGRKFLEIVERETKNSE